jgi:dephospho-CoA kinase
VIVRVRTFAILCALSALVGVARGQRPAAGKRIVVVVAYPGAGKGEFGKILERRVRARGWVSSDVIREELARLGLEATPQNFAAVGKEMQAAEPGVVGRRLAAGIAASRGRRHFVDGLRTVADVRALLSVFPEARLAKIDVPAEVRHARMLKRGRLGETTLEVLRGRDASDDKLGVGDLMRLELGRAPSFLLEPGEGLDSLEAEMKPVIDFLRSRQPTPSASRSR